MAPAASRPSLALLGTPKEWRQATRMGEAARARNISYVDVYLGACWRRWASRGMWPNSYYHTNPHPLPYDRTITTHPTRFHPSLYTLHPPTQGGIHATQGNGHTTHTPQTHVGGGGGHMMRSSQQGYVDHNQDPTTLIQSCKTTMQGCRDVQIAARNKQHPTRL